MTRLTKVELESIRKRVDAATPGPWYVDVFGDEVRSNESDLSVAYDITNEANAEFIAHAREDVPKLLSLVEYQQAEIERLNDVIKQLTETTESFLDDKHFYMDELKKTEEALRKANEEIERVKSEKDEYLKRYVWLLEYVGRKKAAEIFRQRLKEEGDTDDNEA